MRRSLIAPFLMAAAAAASCNALYGIDELCGDCRSTQTGDGGAAGGSSGTDGGGGVSCKPAAMRACYSGPEGTQGVGTCSEGVETCSDDGSGWGPCEGEVIPRADSCDSPEDEDCNGYACLETVWSKSFGGAGNEQTRALVLSQSAELLIAGSYNDTIDFGTGALADSGNGSSAFLATLSPSDGSAAASFAIDATFGTIAASSLAAHPSGGRVLGFELQGLATIAGTTLTSSGMSDGVVALTDENGAVSWVLSFGGDGEDDAEDVAVLSGGDVIVAGGVNGPNTHFGNITNLPDYGGFDGVLARLAAQDGSVVWVNTYGSNNTQFVTQVEVTRSGNIIVAGYFRNQIDFGNVTHNSQGDYDIVVAELTPDGAEVWSTAFGGVGADRVHDMKLDADGNILLSGMYVGDLTFGNDMHAATDDDAFVAKLDENGFPMWSLAFGTSEPDTAYAVAADPTGNIWVAGRAGAGLDLGAGPLGGNPNQPNLLVFKLDPFGTILHSRLLPIIDEPPNPPTGFWPGRRYLAVDEQGFGYVTGYFRTTLDFAPEVLTNAGGDDIFVAKLAP